MNGQARQIIDKPDVGAKIPADVIALKGAIYSGAHSRPVHTTANGTVVNTLFGEVTVRGSPTDYLSNAAVLAAFGLPIPQKYRPDAEDRQLTPGD